MPGPPTTPFPFPGVAPPPPEPSTPLPPKVAAVALGAVAVRELPWAKFPWSIRTLEILGLLYIVIFVVRVRLV